MKRVSILMLLTAMSATAVHAVCLDARDPLLNTYRYPTLKEEAAESDAIVVGKVVEWKGIATPDDPEGYYEFIYTVAVKETIKGPSPSRFKLHVENTSGDYRMADGETHLLLLVKRRGEWFVDPCGNSNRLEKSAEKLGRLRDARFTEQPLSADDLDRMKRSEQFMAESSVHGRLRYYNGNPTARIWLVGTRHILGIRDAEPGVNIPRELSELMSFDRDIFADFEVEPLVEFKPGVMRIVRILSVRNIVVTENNKIVMTKDKL